MGNARQVQSNPVARAPGAGGALQRLGAGNPLGPGNAPRDDCYLHVSLRGNLQGPIWPERFTLGLCALSLLWLAAVDGVSGITTAFVHHHCVARQPGQARRLSAGDSAGSADAGGSGKSNVRHGRAIACPLANSSSATRQRDLVTGSASAAIDSDAGRGLVAGFAGSFSARHRAGNFFGAAGLDVPDANYLSGIDRARTLSSRHPMESLHAAGSLLPPRSNRWPPARLAGPRLLHCFCGYLFCVWLLVVRQDTEELRRCDLMWQR